jgi:heavy metal translocating P-type ATPase
VLALALAAALGWLILPVLAGGVSDVERAVFAGLTVLVMGYPCALGISAPLSIVRGAGEAAERGILMRTGEAFQGFRLATHVVFDKTGTLTEGKPALREVLGALGVPENELLGIAAAAEAASEHPLAKAVLAAALERGIAPPPLEDFEAVPGRGVRAKLSGQELLVGNIRFLEENGVPLDVPRVRVRALEENGRTVILVARAKRFLGLLAFGDALRPHAAKTISALRGAGVRTLLVSGDNAAACRRIAARAGIDEVHAGLLPQDKAALIRRLQEAGKVAMVGDGINDAPALMQANIGIAMGSGTDIAIDSADIIILNNRLEAVLDAREISRWSYRKMVQNVFLAMLFNGIGVPLAATGLVFPIWAMAAMATSVTLIFLNSLWGRPSLFFDAVMSVGRPPAGARPVAA